MLPLFSTFIIYLLFFFISDLFILNTDLKLLSGTIEKTVQYQYYQSEMIGKGPKADDVLEIHTGNYVIRLSDGFEKQSWTKIDNPHNVGKTLQIWFSPRLQNDNLILNPEKLKINGITILSLEDQKSAIIWISACFFIFLIFLILLQVWIVKTYRVLYLEKDKKSLSPLIWEIVKQAFNE